jgi:26S proteasome regulatory subunit N3
MKSKEVGDVYATREPGEAFHDRIRACLALHDESVMVCLHITPAQRYTNVARQCVSQ